MWCVKEGPFVVGVATTCSGLCGARGVLSTLVYVRAVVCKNCLVPSCAAEVPSCVTRARSAEEQPGSQGEVARA